jgi:hypothetical protein
LVAYVPGGTIRVVQPNDGEEWTLGSEHLISWTLNFAEPVKVELTRADTVYSVLSSSVTGNSLAWTISDTLPADSNYKVRVTSTIDTTILDNSDSTFSLLAYPPGKNIKVIQPNGGEGWTVGTEHLISWTLNFGNPVKVELIRADTVYSLLSSSVTGNSFAWTISDTLSTDSNYKIRVTNTVETTILDNSDSTFSLTASPPGETLTVIQPNGGESWTAGSEHVISWNSNITGKLDIYLIDSASTPVSATRIYHNVQGTTKTWKLKNHYSNYGKHYVILIANADSTVVDKSDSLFSIIIAPTIDASSVDVYPNPSTTQVTLKFNEKDNNNYILTLYNRYNKMVMTKPVNTMYMKEVRINTFDLPSGIYFLRLVSGKQVISKKIIVQH